MLCLCSMTHSWFMQGKAPVKQYGPMSQWPCLSDWGKVFLLLSHWVLEAPLKNGMCVEIIHLTCLELEKGNLLAFMNISGKHLLAHLVQRFSSCRSSNTSRATYMGPSPPMYCHSNLARLIGLRESDWPKVTYWGFESGSPCPNLSPLWLFSHNRPCIGIEICKISVSWVYPTLSLNNNNLLIVIK